ncbi:hypothetical protein [Aeromonas sanarellii]
MDMSAQYCRLSPVFARRFPPTAAALRTVSPKKNPDLHLWMKEGDAQACMFPQGHLKLLIVLKIVHSDQVLDKQAKKPFFTQAIGLTPVPQAINIRPVSTRQAIPP